METFNYYLSLNHIYSLTAHWLVEKFEYKHRVLFFIAGKWRVSTLAKTFELHSGYA